MSKKTDVVVPDSLEVHVARLEAELEKPDITDERREAVVELLAVVARAPNMTDAERKAEAAKIRADAARRKKKAARADWFIDNLGLLCFWGGVLAGIGAAILFYVNSKSPSWVYSGPAIILGLAAISLVPAGWEIVTDDAKEKEIQRRVDEATKQLKAKEDIKEANKALPPAPPTEKAAEARLQLFSLSSLQRSRALGAESKRQMRRAGWALLASFAGPAMAAYVVYWGLDPHYLFASVALSAVPLTIAGLLLNHDKKVRAHQREEERELTRLERIRLAVDYAKTTKSKTFAEDIKRAAVKQILTMEPVPVEETKDEPDGGAVEAASEIVGALKPGGES